MILLFVRILETRGALSPLWPLGTAQAQPPLLSVTPPHWRPLAAIKRLRTDTDHTHTQHTHQVHWEPSSSAADATASHHRSFHRNHSCSKSAVVWREKRPVHSHSACFFFKSGLVEAIVALFSLLTQANDERSHHFWDAREALVSLPILVSFNLASMVPQRSTKGASKARRDHINHEIRNMRALLPIPLVDQKRLSYLHSMAAVCTYIRKSVLLQGEWRRAPFFQKVLRMKLRCFFL